MTKKLFRMIVSLIFAMSSIHITGIKAKEIRYKIYPSPHDISYQDKLLQLSDMVNVIYSEGIDKYTKAKAKEVLTILHKSLVETKELSSTHTNLLIGIKGKDDVVNKYFKEKALLDEDILAKNDGHLISIKDNVIAILGKDTDAAFRGLTTLKHIANQINGKEIQNLVIKDYADIKGRGFIEGYYGNPWSNADRADLMMFGGEYKCNQYIYAPKDDPKHNGHWRELYTEKELQEISKLAEAGNVSKCYYVYALHTFMNNPIRFDSNYEADLNIIKTKFEQLMKVGVKQFAILADDANAPKEGSYVRLMSDLTKWLEEKKASYEGLKTDTIFCPNDYMGWGNSAQIKGLKQLPDSVSIIQTGGQVWGHVGRDFNDAFYRNVGRPAYMWINWPCSDNTKDSLIMGGAEKVLHAGVDPKTVEGIVLNPMQQSEPSKQAIFTNADYAWHIWEKDAYYKQVWQDSFAYVDHGTAQNTAASDALREMSKHMMNSAKLYNEESLDLKNKLAAFKLKLEAGNNVTLQAKELINEFTKLKAAAETYKASGRERLKKQIIYWLDCFEDTSTAIMYYLKTAISIDAKLSNNEIWTQFAKAQEYNNKSKTHTFNYIDHDEHAVVGRKYITPFMHSLDSILATKMESIVDPSKQIISVISNRDDIPSGNKKNILDNKESTEIIYKDPASIAKGTYIGILYTNPIDIENVTFKLGRNGNLRDTFAKAKVEYSKDGQNWLALEKEYDQPEKIVLRDLKLKNVKGIRVIASQEKNNTWLGIRDIIVNQQEEEVDKATITLNKVEVKAQSLANINDGDDSTYAHFAEHPYKQGDKGDYIPVDATVTLNFNKEKELTNIHFVQDSGTDKIKQFVFEYSVDGNNWQLIKKYENGESKIDLDLQAQKIKAKAIRVRNTALNMQADGKSGYWWKLYEFTEGQKVQTNLSPRVIHTNRWTVYRGKDADLLDNNENTALDFNAQPTIQAGDYIGLDLGKVIQVGKVHIVVGGNRSAGDKFDKYALEYSEDNQIWKTYKTYNGKPNQKDYIDEDLNGIKARYVRLVNQASKPVWVIFSDFIVKEYNADGDYSKKGVFTNTKLDLKADVKLAIATLKKVENITLQKDEYIGLDLSRIKDIRKVIALYNNKELSIEYSLNDYDWQKLDLNKAFNARYIRIINKTAKEQKVSINKFSIESYEVKEPSLKESTIGINSSWGVSEDSRYNKAAFDGDVDTTTEFADFVTKGQYITYDLGQMRTIRKLELFAQDSAVNYIRDADIFISENGKDYQKVMSIGDGKENTNDAHVKCIDSDAGYKASSKYPNKVSISANISPTKARYLKIVMTADARTRAVLFNEIMINDGEYVPMINDPTFNSNVVEKRGHNPQKMFDGNLTTSYLPDTDKAGSITYTLSEKLQVKRFNIVQKSNISNALVEVEVEEHNQRHFVPIGRLSSSLNELYVPYDRVFNLRISWLDKKVPEISEIVQLSDRKYGMNKDVLKKYLDELNVIQEDYTEDSYNYFKNVKDAAYAAVNSDHDIEQNYLKVRDAYNSLKHKTATLLSVHGEKYILKTGVDFIMRSSSKIENFIKLLVDDKEVDRQNYTLKSGSTIVSLKASYLNTLGVGKHTVTIVSKDGNVSASVEILANNQPNPNPRVEPNPSSNNHDNSHVSTNHRLNNNHQTDREQVANTSDKINLYLYASILATTIALVMISLKKRKISRN